MIITLVGGMARLDKSLLAVNLAALRAAGGRQVLLIDTDPHEFSLRWQDQRAAAGLRPGVAAYAFSGIGLQLELERLKLRFQDFIIDCAGADSRTDRAALIAARLAIVPVHTNLLQGDSAAQLSDRINTARLFNPTLRVLLVNVALDSTAPALPDDAVRACARQFMSAMLHPVALTNRGELVQAFEQGRSIAELRGVEPAPVALLERFARDAFDYAGTPGAPTNHATALISTSRIIPPHFLQKDYS